MKQLLRMKKTEIVLFLTPFIARWPLLSIGFGVEEDAWGHVLNGMEMAESGGYIISRLPSHPLMEALSFVLWKTIGPMAFYWNLFFSLAASWAVVEFYRLARCFQIQHPFLLSLAFGFVPTVFLSGAAVMDYAFQLALGLWAYRLFHLEKWTKSGALLGMAMGFRLSSALFLLAFLISLLVRKRSIRSAALILAPALLISALFYLLAFLSLGIDFFSTYPLPYPPMAKVLYKGSIGVFGSIGLFSLIWYGLPALPKAVRSAPLVWSLMVLFHIALFIRLPEKSAFLIPAVPFLLLMCAQNLRADRIKRLSWGLLISALMAGVNFTHPHRGSDKSALSASRHIAGQEISFDFLIGPIAADYSKRWNKLNYVENVHECVKQKKEPALVLAGWWYAMLRLQEYPGQIVDSPYRYYLPPRELKTALNKGLRIFALPEQDAVNARKYAYEATDVEMIELSCP